MPGSECLGACEVRISCGHRVLLWRGKQKDHRYIPVIWHFMAPRVGFEPTTLRLTAGCSAVELPRNLVRCFVAQDVSLQEFAPNARTILERFFRGDHPGHHRRPRNRRMRTRKLSCAIGARSRLTHPFGRAMNDGALNLSTPAPASAGSGVRASGPCGALEGARVALSCALRRLAMSPLRARGSLRASTRQEVQRPERP